MEKGEEKMEDQTDEKEFSNLKKTIKQIVDFKMSMSCQLLDNQVVLEKLIDLVPSSNLFTVNQEPSLKLRCKFFQIQFY